MLILSFIFSELMGLIKEGIIMLGKKSFVLLSTLGLAVSSMTSYADKASTSSHSFEITTPEVRHVVEYSVALIGLKPAATNLNYVIYNKELPVQSPTWIEKEIDTQMTAAFELGIKYHFSAGRYVSLDWTHLNSSSDNAISAPNASYFLGPDYEIGPDGIEIRHAVGSAQFKYDVINLNAGQALDFGQHVETRFFMGLSNGYLREQVNATYSGVTIITTPGHFGPFSTKQKVTANFTGIGPRFGFDASYLTDRGFVFFGEAAASALIGSNYSKTAYISSSQELLDLYGQTVNYQTIKDQHVTQVIPGFDGKLGVSYEHLFSHDVLLTLSAGYQAAVYINAISQYIPASLVSNEPMQTGGIFVDTMSHTLSNYSVQGPFLKAILHC